MREAAELASASVDVMRSIDHRWGVARAQLGLGDLARVRGDLADAQPAVHARRWHTCGRSTPGRRSRAACPGSAGWRLEAGATTLAREHLTESLRLSRDIGTRIGVARGLESFAALAAREGEPSAPCCSPPPLPRCARRPGLPPLSGARADRYLAAARRLGDAAVAELWARGLELSPSAAIAVALSRRAAPRRRGMPRLRRSQRQPRPAASPPSALTPGNWRSPRWSPTAAATRPSAPSW